MAMQSMFRCVIPVVVLSALTVGCPRSPLERNLVIAKIIAFEPTNEVITDVAFPSVLQEVDGSGHTWTLESDGTVIEGENVAAGTSDAFDGFLQLVVDGTNFPGQTVFDVEDGLEFVYGPELMSGLQVSRKVLVSPNAGFARWLEILENPDQDIRVETRVTLTGNLGSDEGNLVVSATTNGDLVLDSTDDWWVNCQDHPSDPCVGSFQCAAAMSKTGDDFFYDFGVVIIPPQGRVVLATYMLMRSVADLDDAVFDMVVELDMLEEYPLVDSAYLVGMTAAELNAVRSCGGNVEVMGLPGAVEPSSMVVAQNAETFHTGTTEADAEGAFRLSVGGVSGQEIDVRSSDGQRTTRRVP